MLRNFMTLGSIPQFSPGELIFNWKTKKEKGGKCGIEFVFVLGLFLFIAGILIKETERIETGINSSRLLSILPFKNSNTVTTLLINVNQKYIEQKEFTKAMILISLIIYYWPRNMGVLEAIKWFTLTNYMHLYPDSEVRMVNGSLGNG